MLKILYFIALTYGISSFAKVSTPQELKRKLTEISKTFEERKNHSIVFSSTYLIITNQFIEALENDFFENPGIVRKVIVDFGNRYLDHLQTPHSKCPKVWRISFKTDKDTKTNLSTKLLLAMNAHITYDLPFALSKVLKSPADWKNFRNDYFKMNLIFKRSIPNLITNLKSLYGVLGLKSLSFKNHLIFFLTKSWRKKAWNHGKALHLSKNSPVVKRFMAISSSLRSLYILKSKGLIPNY